MREIKFRAWDGLRMRYDVTGFEHGSHNEMEGIFLDGNYYTMNENKKHTHQVAISMQYTGLHDRYGVEIYEGDIITCGDVKTVITFLDGKFQMITSEQQGQSPVYQERLNRFEVIGNVYENPELMEENRWKLKI